MDKTTAQLLLLLADKNCRRCALGRLRLVALPRLFWVRPRSAVGDTVAEAEEAAVLSFYQKSPMQLVKSLSCSLPVFGSARAHDDWTMRSRQLLPFKLSRWRSWKPGPIRKPLLLLSWPPKPFDESVVSPKSIGTAALPWWWFYSLPRSKTLPLTANGLRRPRWLFVAFLPSTRLQTTPPSSPTLHQSINAGGGQTTGSLVLSWPPKKAEKIMTHMWLRVYMVGYEWPENK